MVKHYENQLTPSVDYTVSVLEGYQNVQAGTAAIGITLCGNYGGSKSTKFTILPKELNDKDITIDVIPMMLV